ncbi:FG-GAP repeat protein [Natrinema salsiterrestre]|uniref:FG-GAP repeat protein n=1 Tax=Natrinema salsiterrestre TaxID=2950540 RepID=A0A9Q4L6N3_9EURY|nr:FG-GAP repeat protein [Natrinema salsiterrestre]MDF9748249.1 FG-GAP repeat protein [Natrinema salsiterrestre]
MMRDEYTRRTILGYLAGGTFAGISGCLEVFSENGTSPKSEGENWKTVSPKPFTEVSKPRSPVATLGSSDRSESFGQEVATTGDTVFVGVPQAAPDGVKKAGIVAVFERSGTGWEQTATLTGRKHKRDYFGGQIAASGSTLLVGNEYNYSGTSRIPVSVFERSNGDGWQLTTELTEGVYIESMAVADDTAVLRTADSDGLVDVFERESREWRRRQTLSDTSRDDGRIVRSIATDGKTILVGAPPKSGPKRRRTGSGVVHVFSRSSGTWSHRTTLSGATGKDHFGWSVSVVNGKALIGDYINDTAYVFGLSDEQWSREQMYTATSGGSHQYFGNTVAIDGDTLLVGAPHAQFGDSVGAVYNLDQPSSTNESRGIYFTAPDTTEQFGDAIATRNGTTIVAGRDSEESFVYIYE